MPSKPCIGTKIWRRHKDNLPAFSTSLRIYETNSHLRFSLLLFLLASRLPRPILPWDGKRFNLLNIFIVSTGGFLDNANGIASGSNTNGSRGVYVPLDLLDQFPVVFFHANMDIYILDGRIGVYHNSLDNARSIEREKIRRCKTRYSCDTRMGFSFDRRVLVLPPPSGHN